MTVKLYEGCYGVTRGDADHPPESQGPFRGSVCGEAMMFAVHGMRPLWTESGRFVFAHPSTHCDITFVGTEAECRAELARRLKERDGAQIADNTPDPRHAAIPFPKPADPAPVVWPDGVTEMRFGAGRDNIAIAGGYISINDGTLSFKAPEAIQLAALLVAAANKIGGK